MALNWEEPHDNEIATATEFLETRGESFHEAFALKADAAPSRPRSKGSLSKSDLNLEQALASYIPSCYGIQSDSADIEDLCSRVVQLESSYQKSQDSVWSKLWYRVGKNRDYISEWTEIIPDTHSLALVKAGVGVVLKLAGDSASKRDNIFRTFARLRDSVASTDRSKISFQGHQDVKTCMENLRGTVLESINDMIALLGTSRRRPCTRRIAIPHIQDLQLTNTSGARKPSLESILSTLDARTDALQQSLNVARDQVTEATGTLAQLSIKKTTVIQGGVSLLLERSDAHSTQLYDLSKDTKIIAELFLTEREKRDAMARENETRLREDASSAKHTMLGILVESQRIKAENNYLRRRMRETQDSAARQAVISLDRFLKLLAWPDPISSDENSVTGLVRHANEDLDHVLRQRLRFPGQTQKQVQSLLHKDRFLSWLRECDPDLILVNANIQSTGLDKISYLSVFSADLITSLINLNSNDVVVYFFCGLHVSPREHMYGPEGLVRSLIMQSVMRLRLMESLQLDFIHDRNILRDLERHDLNALCYTLKCLLMQFTDPDTTIYCLIDSIHWFDQHLTYERLRMVLECLGDIVDDPSLVPLVKVLLTNPAQSTRRMTQLPVLQENGIINLSPNSSVSLQVSSVGIEAHIARSISPSNMGSGRYEHRSRNDARTHPGVGFHFDDWPSD